MGISRCVILGLFGIGIHRVDDIYEQNIIPNQLLLLYSEYRILNTYRIVCPL